MSSTFLNREPSWTRKPKELWIRGDMVEVMTEPYTDLWQRTYYGFQRDNAPVYQVVTDEPYFSFVAKTHFESKRRFDQCGIIVYLNSEKWIKASVEFENEMYQRLGSVVTSHGYSDWASTDISSDIKNMWYRLSRRGADYCIECSRDGREYRQMRICHFAAGEGRIAFGIYACSPEASSFRSIFSDLEITDCKWQAHH